MGCRCCRMMKSYIYEPSPEQGRKSDSSGNSLYHPHHLTGHTIGSNASAKQLHGINNLGYNKSYDSTLKLEVDNNQVNRFHAAPPPASELYRQGSAPPAEGGLYIIQPEAPGPRWVMQERGPIQVPVYPNIHQYDNPALFNQSGRTGSYGEQGQTVMGNRWDASMGGSESLSADEIDEGVGGTPEYPCDTGDEGSVLSVDIHTSTASMSSTDTKDNLRLPKNQDLSNVESGISKSEDEEEGKNVEMDSVTDSMVAEALAALEAATAGEDYE
ncbi:uncharacterized protein LOC143009052 [Genypterus blacodes]|uniref:uncharacterized protein LOC143009052 n=1 Tax=Genypterus blacodes TaxID=154954 RepID=UPI003F75FEE2